nr:tRNA preQ1(34) S-adenosylmethionine ribosyltransferase-isomerase QueA [Bacilli bacterium]
MDTKDFDFVLPEELIAQHPTEVRSMSRLLVMDRKADSISHGHFYDLVQYLQPGDLLIANDSRVIPARLYGVKEGTGAAVEVLLLRPLSQAGQWETLVRPGKRLMPGHTISFGDGRLSATIQEVGEGGTRTIEFSAYGDRFEELLEQLGEMPLPPYIRERLEDKERYQTVYAKQKGSVAAPTAGLHFTPQLIEKLEQKGVHMHFITLHVGLGTFRPVQSDTIEDHHMHEEWYRVDPEIVEAIVRARADGRRIISVGTTTVRALESAFLAMEKQGLVPDVDHLPKEPITGLTDIFIYPGVKIRATDGLITNFHLPKSTLLMLVSTLTGRDRLMAAYETAVLERYRFFSFGDAMLIL